MGMDLSVYEVRFAKKGESGQEVSPYPLAPDQVEHYSSLFKDLIYDEEIVDMEGLLAKYSDHPSNALIVAWDLVPEPEKSMFIEVKTQDGTQVLNFTEEQVQEFAETAKWLNLASNVLYCKEHVYVRKPFRKDLRLDMSEIKGDTLILRSNNFAGADADSISGLMGPTAKTFSMFFAGKEKLDVIKKLAQLSNDPKYWQEHIVSRIENLDNMYLAINW